MKVAGKKAFEPAPEYQGAAVCVDITELRNTPSEWGDRETFRFVFELDLEREDGTRWCVWSKPFTPSLGAKANLPKFLKGWFGRSLNADEIKDGIELESLVGQSVNLTVVHENGNSGEVYANIALIKPWKGDPLEPSGVFKREKDRKGKRDEDDEGGGEADSGTAKKPTKGSDSSYRRADQGSKAPVPTDHGRIKVHVGKNRGIELRDLTREAIELLIEKWLSVDYPKIAKPSADDKRLAAALEKYKAKFIGKEDEDEDQDDVPMEY